MTELAQVSEGGIPWYVFVPSLVMLGFVVLTAPIWSYNREWGWAVAGMAGVGLFVAVLFSLTWLVS